MTSSRSSTTICKVCQQHWSRYTCPRCNLQYCCLECYKKHGDSCTETFYRDHATEHLQSLQASDTEKQRMLQILQRLQQPDDAELSDSVSDNADDSDVGLSHQLQAKLSMMESQEDIEINDQDLSPAELRDFERAVANGQLNKFVDAWVPWWSLPEAGTVQLSAAGTSKVSLQDPDAGTASASSMGLPAAPKTPLPLLASLTKAVPSPLLQWQLLDILYTYCFIMRFYNGEPHSDPQEVTSSALQVSRTLQASAAQATSQMRQSDSLALDDRTSAPVMPSTASEALLSCIELACSPAVAGSVSRAIGVGLLQDVAALVKHGRSVVVLALNDLQRLFSQKSPMQSCKLAATMPGSATQPPTAVQHPKSQSHCQMQPKLKKQSNAAKAQSRAVSQKLYFLLSWANELTGPSYATLFEVVVDEMQHHISTLSKSNQEAKISISDPFVKSTMQVQPLSKQQSVIEEM